MAITPSTFAYADACPSGGEHTYTAKITKYPTDDEDGIRHYACTKCGYSLEKAIPAVGHVWGSWIRDLEPTCSHEGHEYRVCNKQSDSTHYEERSIARLSPTGEHSYKLTSEVAVTCTESGYRSYTCSYCGDMYGEETAALGHEWGEWETAVEPKATKAGEKQRVCMRDVAHSESEIIPATGEKEAVVKEKSKTSEKDRVSPKPSPVAKPPKPEMPLVYFQFSAFDAACIAFDGALLLIAVFFLTPLIAQFRFAQKKRAAARAKRTQVRVETERNEWDWQR